YPCPPHCGGPDAVTALAAGTDGKLTLLLLGDDQCARFHSQCPRQVRPQGPRSATAGCGWRLLVLETGSSWSSPPLMTCGRGWRGWWRCCGAAGAPAGAGGGPPREGAATAR